MISRTGKLGQAVAVLPLIIVPFLHIVSGTLAGLFTSDRRISDFMVRITFDIVGLVAACVLFGLLAGNMETKRAKRLYIIFCAVFSIVLTLTLVYNTASIFDT